jgi:mannobiose 2-epimerase
MNNHSAPHRIICSLGLRQAAWVLPLVLLLAAPGGLSAADRAAYAALLKTQLVQKIMPYWYDTAIDKQYGGYLLSDDAVTKAPPALEKQLVSQTRMIWGFSHAHLKHLSDGKRNYLQAAEQGYRFLIAHFLDPEYGGYYWTTDLAGKPLDDRKLMYGQSFVLYALAEYYRASGDTSALHNAVQLFNKMQEFSHDSVNGGWIEHLHRDWTPILSPTPDAIVEISGYKSANTHLHLMEALTELYAVTGDFSVRRALEEALRINATYFYPPEPGRSSFHRQLNWQPVTGPQSAGLSYGHNVEFAWLMIRAQTVLGKRPAWDHFAAELDHALKYGYDPVRGGLYSRGFDDRPATDKDKVWWVQAEMLAALTDGLKHQENPVYAAALEKLLQFVLTYQANPADGIWLDTVTAEGRPKNTAKAHNWKANYHDVRAMLKFIDAFTPETKGRWGKRGSAKTAAYNSTSATNNPAAPTASKSAPQK